MLGVGGFGTVYAADHPSGTRFAIKKIEKKEELADAMGLGSMDQFANEVATLSRYQHPNVVPEHRPSFWTPSPDVICVLLLRCL